MSRLAVQSASSNESILLREDRDGVVTLTLRPGRAVRTGGP